MTGNVPTPLVRVLLAGSTADPSEDVNATVPAYAAFVAPEESSAVTVIENAVPAVTGDVLGVIWNCVAGPADTEIDPEMPVINPDVAVMVWLPVAVSVAVNVPEP